MWRGRAAAGGLCAALFLGAAGAGVAQQAAPAAPPQIAAPLLTLDDERLFLESRFGKALVAQHEAETQALIAENRQIETGLEAEEKDLTTRRAAMTPQDFIPLSEAFNEKVEGIRAAQDAKSRDLTQRYEAEKARFFEATKPVLARLMQERGAVAIIDKRAVLVGFENVDITSAAVQALDASLGDGSLPTPTPQP